MKKGGITMKKESITLIVAVVVILIIALIGFNFQGITGYPTLTNIKTDTKIEVYPTTPINAGEYINVEVTPGARCVDRRAYIYYTVGGGVKATLQPVGTSKQKLCEPFTLTYKTHPSWAEDPGVYYVKVFDFGTKDFVKDIFVIQGE